MGEDDEILAANAAYYRAFAGGDFAAMSRIWAPDQVSCVHPGWPVLVGRAAVLEFLAGHPRQSRAGADRISRSHGHGRGRRGAGAVHRGHRHRGVRGVELVPAYRRHLAHDPPPRQPDRAAGRRRRPGAEVAAVELSGRGPGASPTAPRGRSRGLSRRAMAVNSQHGLAADRRRALRLLAAAPDGARRGDHAGSWASRSRCSTAWCGTGWQRRNGGQCGRDDVRFG